MDFAIEEGSGRPLLGGLAHGHDWRSVRRGWRGGLWCSCQCAQRRGCFQHLDQERWRQEREDSVSPGRDAIVEKAANIQTRETIKRVLSLPADTNMVWKSHDDSITQRSAIDQARQEKTGHHGERRRNQNQSSTNNNGTSEEKVAA